MQTDDFTAGLGMSELVGMACPVCEYQHGNPGKPVAHNGEMRCLSCGSSWKQFTNSVPVANQDNEVSKSGDADSSGVSSGPHTNINADEYLERKNPAIRPASFAVMAGLAMLIVSIGVTLIFLGNGNSENAGLHVADIRFEEMVHSGGKVVRVKGVIENSGAESEIVPRVALVLRKANGSELTRWYYNSSVAKLQPGARTRFVSSIQYDTPFIASVEAMFE